MNINIDMTDKDFGMLHVESCLHDPGLPYAQSLEPYEDATEPVSEDFTHIYWLEPGWTTVMLAKAFLTAQGAAFQLVYDHSAEECCWAILTDYRDAAMDDVYREVDAMNDDRRCRQAGHHVENDTHLPSECSADGKQPEPDED